MESKNKKLSFVTFIKGTANKESWKSLEKNSLLKLDESQKSEDQLAAVAAEKVTWEILKSQYLD
jgi:hypothetical protein